MKRLFTRHYTREEARALLPEIRRWLSRLSLLRREINRCDTAISKILAKGRDAGGNSVNRMTGALADFNEVFLEFRQREIQVKDIERGLIDFPAILDGREVFLCWELSEKDINHWHDLDAGYAGRQEL